MEGIWVLAAILVCPIVMGTMMLFMMRGKKSGSAEQSGEDPP